MTATVVPDIAYRTGYLLGDQWHIGCGECNYFPPAYFDHAVAVSDAALHNQKFHGFCEAETVHDMILRVAWQNVAAANDRVRWERIFALVYVIFGTAIIGAFAPPLAALAFVTGGTICRFGWTWGRATARAQAVNHDYERLHLAYQQIAADHGWVPDETE